MTNPVSDVKNLIRQVRQVVTILGSEALDGLSLVREYHDEQIFISIDEGSDRVWVAIPIWDEDLQEVIWHAVLDVPEDGMPEKFLVNVVSEHGDLVWVSYLTELQAYIDAQPETIEKIDVYRYMRKLLGDFRVDLFVLVDDLLILQQMELRSMNPVVNLFNRLMDIPADRRLLLLELVGAM